MTPDQDLFRELQNITRVLLENPADNSDAMNEIISVALKLTDSHNAEILKVRGDYLKIIASIHPTTIGMEFHLGDCVCGMAVKENRIVNLQDVKNSPYSARFKQVLPLNTNSELVVPIRKKNMPTAVINIESEHYHAFNSIEESLLRLLAEEASLALQYSTQIIQKQAIAELFEIQAKKLSSPNQIFPLLLQVCLKLLDAKFGQVLVRRGDYLVVIATTGDEPPEKTRVRIDACVSGKAIIAKQAVNIPNVTLPPWNNLYQKMLGDMRSELVVPIMDTGNPIGVINIESPLVNHFDSDSLDVLNDIASFTSSLIRQSQLKQSIRTGIHSIHGTLSGVSRSLEFTKEKLLKNQLPSIEFIDRTKEQVSILQRVVGRILMPSENIVPILVEDVLQNTVSNLALSECIRVTQSYRTRELPLVSGDVGLLAEAFQCILENAVDAVREVRDPEIALIADLLADSKLLEIQVRDNGHGISEEDLPKIFDLFFTTKKDRSDRKGYGIGLAFVREALDRMNGDIRVESSLGRGTTFYIRVPTIVGAALAKQESGVLYHKHPLNILLLDDDDSWCNLVLQVLKRAGHNANRESSPQLDGTEGYEFVTRVLTSYDVIIVDLIHEKTDRFHLLSRLATACKTQSTKKREISAPRIAAVSFSPTPMDAVETLKLGVVNLFTKPYTEQEVLKLVDSLYREPPRGFL